MNKTITNKNSDDGDSTSFHTEYNGAEPKHSIRYLKFGKV